MQDHAFRIPAEAPQRTVLYVEDHVVNVLLMQALFAKLPGARLVVATTGDAGWRAGASGNSQRSEKGGGHVETYA